jgi:hypothetical protein
VIYELSNLQWLGHLSETVFRNAAVRDFLVKTGQNLGEINGQKWTVLHGLRKLFVYEM